MQKTKKPSKVLPVMFSRVPLHAMFKHKGEKLKKVSDKRGMTEKGRIVELPVSTLVERCS